MSSIHVPVDYFDWRKTRDLVRLLGEGSELLPIRLWCHCGEHPEDAGKIAENLLHKIEPVMEWRGSRGAAIDALKETLFLMAVLPGEVQVVDWLVVGGHILKNKARAIHAINSRYGRTPSNTRSTTPSSTPSITLRRGGIWS